MFDNLKTSGPGSEQPRKSVILIQNIQMNFSMFALSTGRVAAFISRGSARICPATDGAIKLNNRKQKRTGLRGKGVAQLRKIADGLISDNGVKLANKLLTSANDGNVPCFRLLVGLADGAEYGEESTQVRSLLTLATALAAEVGCEKPPDDSTAPQSECAGSTAPSEGPSKLNEMKGQGDHADRHPTNLGTAKTSEI